MTNCVTCPEPSNVGDVALQLQYTALQAEECIFDQEKLLRSAVNRPTFVSVSTSAWESGSGGGLFIDVGMQVTHNILFNNTSWPIWEFVTIDGGVYQLGATITPTAVGVADNNSFRVMRLAAGPESSSTLTNVAYYTAYETTASGGNDMSISAVFNCQPLDSISLSFAHSNTSSNISIPAGALFWVTRLGDAVATKVV